MRWIVVALFAVVCLPTVTALSDVQFYTSVLGLSSDADLTTIRKAYRRLSLELHPDKNTDNPAAQQQFIKVVEAYEALLQAHTQSRTEEDSTLVQQGHSTINYWRSMQASMDKSRGVPGLSGHQHMHRAPDTVEKVSLPVQSLHRGDLLTFTRQKSFVCPACHGRGGSEHVHKCGNCGGSGLAMQFGPGGSTMITGCDQCGGVGIIGRCNVCAGSGLIQVPKQYTLQLPAKTAVGSSVRYYGDGNESPHSDIPGDFVMEFDMDWHHMYRRQGNNLYVFANANENTVFPITVSFPSLDGYPLEVTHPGPFQNGMMYKFAGEGLWYDTQSTMVNVSAGSMEDSVVPLENKARGDLYVVFSR